MHPLNRTLSVILTFGVLTGSLSQSFAMDPTPPEDKKVICNDELSNAGPAKSAIDSSRELTALLAAVAAGTAPISQIKPTPSNQRVEFYITEGRGGSRLKGRIISAYSVTNGVELSFVTIDDNDIESKTAKPVPLSSITFDDEFSVRVVNISTPAQRAAILSLVEEAYRTGSFIEFIDQFGTPKLKQGRVESVHKDPGGKFDRFNLTKASGHTSGYVINNIDPNSVRVFTVQAPVLSGVDSSFLTELTAAKILRQYVSFRYQEGNEESLFEGWIVGVEATIAGGYLIKTNRDGPDASSEGEIYKFPDIIAGSFNRNPQLIPHAPAEGRNRNAIHLDGIIEYPNESRSLDADPLVIPLAKYLPQLIDTLSDTLSAYADRNQPSGPELPSELKRLLPSRGEIRLYFSYGKRKIRLTIRRDVDGNWFFGDTAFDKASVDEDLRYEGQRYTINEDDRLTSERFKKRLPAQALRVHMRTIRRILLQETIEGTLKKELRAWDKSIPEGTNEPIIQKLFLFALGKSFYVNRGLVNEPQQPLPQGEAKILAAIQYLIDNKMEYWSRNANASHVNSGIYPQGTVSVTDLYLMPASFSDGLLKAMAKAGLKYTDGQWVPKTNQ